MLYVLLLWNFTGILLVNVWLQRFPVFSFSTGCSVSSNIFSKTCYLDSLWHQRCARAHLFMSAIANPQLEKTASASLIFSRNFAPHLHIHVSQFFFSSPQLYKERCWSATAYPLLQFFNSLQLFKEILLHNCISALDWQHMPNNTVNLFAFHMDLDKNSNYNKNHSDLGKIIKNRQRFSAGYKPIYTDKKKAAKNLFRKFV